MGVGFLKKGCFGMLILFLKKGFIRCLNINFKKFKIFELFLFIYLNF